MSYQGLRVQMYFRHKVLARSSTKSIHDHPPRQHKPELQSGQILYQKNISSLQEKNDLSIPSKEIRENYLLYDVLWNFQMILQWFSIECIFQIATEKNEPFQDCLLWPGALLFAAKLFLSFSDKRKSKNKSKLLECYARFLTDDNRHILSYKICLESSSKYQTLNLTEDLCSCSQYLNCRGTRPPIEISASP